MRRSLSILAVLIIILSTSIPALGLDETVDNYVDLSQVQGRHNVVRNSTYGAMALNWSSVGIRLYEDFTSFTEVDILTRLSQTANRSTFNLQRTDNNIYLYNDYGAGNFDDVTHEFNVYIDNCDSTATAQYRAVLYSLTNMLGDWLAYWTNTESLDLIAKSNGVAGEWTMRLVSGYNGGSNMWFWNESSALLDDTYYFMRLVRSGRNCSVEVYSDNDRTTLVTRIECDQLFDQTYRYILAPASLDYGSGSYYLQGYLEQLWIGDVMGGYENEGWFYTVQFWPGSTDGLVALLYNLTLGNGDIVRAQVSPDNSTWWTHNLVPGNDTLIQGFEALDLRDLNFTSPYFRFYFIDGGADSTPRIYQIRVVNEATVSAVATTDYSVWILGLVVGLAVGVLAMVGLVYKKR